MGCWFAVVVGEGVDSAGLEGLLGKSNPGPGGGLLEPDICGDDEEGFTLEEGEDDGEFTLIFTVPILLLSALPSFTLKVKLSVPVYPA